MVHTILYSLTLGFLLNLLALDFHSRGILLTVALMHKKQHNNLFEIEWYLRNAVTKQQQNYTSLISVCMCPPTAGLAGGGTSLLASH